ncbi:HNH endonuclease signature motif containing protein, partial [Micromonospora sp. WMMD736]|uniref:HNH endonuclease signature motif containing protein n=1 Tax=Micromonospora sp. WMMD736 TaxID=3404112 RepID=UPI003B925217
MAIAAGQTPEELRKAAERLALLIDQDGPMPDDAERARQRYFRLDKQGPDGMIEVKGRLDPETGAYLEAVLAKSAAPGQCNPDDESPCVDGQPSAEQIQRDTRTQPQRNHDALKAMARARLASGELGKHNGLPVTVIVSTTLQDLESAAGVATTGGTSLLPMSDVIRMAAHAHHYLAIFDTHTSQPLYLGRTRRLASPAQRIMLHARDRGCTFPGCTVPGYGCQVDHVHPWSTGGPTDITNEDLACGPHNKLRNHGWTVRKRHDGRIEWLPPPHLDTGQNRVNNYHHPEELLAPDEDDP